MSAESEARRMGASEGTGLGFIAAGAVMGMAWIGEAFGNPLPFGEGAYAAIFMLLGVGIVGGALAKGRA